MSSKKFWKSNLAENTYSKIAMQRHPELPKDLKHLSWLELDSEDGQEYWSAMQLIVNEAEAYHALIHRSIH